MRGKLRRSRVMIRKPLANAVAAISRSYRCLLVVVTGGEFVERQPAALDVDQNARVDQGCHRAAGTRARFDPFTCVLTAAA